MHDLRCGSMLIEPDLWSSVASKRFLLRDERLARFRFVRMFLRKVQDGT